MQIRMDDKIMLILETKVTKKEFNTIGNYITILNYLVYK